MTLAVACGPAGFLGAGPGRGTGLHRGRPASRPCRELRSAARCVGSVRCPDAQLWLSTSNSARNSSTTDSNIEFASLELQRVWGISKNDRDKLRAKCGWRWCRRCPWVSQSGPAAPSGCHRGLVCLVFGVLWCVLLQTSSIQGVFRVDFCPVVTNVVNSTAFSLIMVVFWA